LPDGRIAALAGHKDAQWSGLQAKVEQRTESLKKDRRKH
jgi:hypothetical protein